VITMQNPATRSSAELGRILFLSVHGDPEAPPGDVQTGGQNIYVRELALRLARMGWVVDVCTRWALPDVPGEESITRGGRVIRLPAGRKGFIPKGMLFSHLPEFLLSLKKRALEDPTFPGLEDYDIVHSNYWLSGWVGRKIHEEWGLPQFHTSHSLGKVKKSLASRVGATINRRIAEERKVYEASVRIIATTPVERDLLQTKYGVERRKILVIPCGYDPAVFHPRGRSRLKAELGLAGKRVALFAGRFDENKGLKALICAWSILAGKGRASDRVLLIAGGDPLDASKVSPEKASVVRLAGEKGILPSVRFLGPLGQGELARYYRAADVCIVPSRYESFGMVALEAMACGCPVVASRVGGLAWLVRDGENGFLVPPGEVRALSGRVEDLFQSPRLRERLSLSAVRMAKRDFTWDAVAQRVSRAYLEVVQRGSCASGTGD